MGTKNDDSTPEYDAIERVAYLEAGIRELMRHHSRQANEERARIVGPVLESAANVSERLIGKTKVRRAIVARLDDLLAGNLMAMED